MKKILKTFAAAAAALLALSSCCEKGPEKGPESYSIEGVWELTKGEFIVDDSVETVTPDGNMNMYMIFENGTFSQETVDLESGERYVSLEAAYTYTYPDIVLTVEGLDRTVTFTVTEITETELNLTAAASEFEPGTPGVVNYYMVRSSL